MFQCVTRAKGMGKDQRGATMVEYALVIVVVALVAIAGLKVLGVNLNSQFATIATTVANPDSAPSE